jgi:PAS domain S-box-containing protein
MESEAKFRGIIEQSIDGITIIDETGTITVFNTAQERLSGIPGSKAIGRKVWDIQYRLMGEAQRRVFSKRAFVAFYRRFLSSGSGPFLEKPFEVDMVRPDGTVVRVQTIVSPIRLPSAVLYASINRDVTDLQRARSELEERNRLLREKNIAMREIMTQVGEEKKDVARRIRANIERHVLPLLERIKVAGGQGVGPYCSIVEENLNDILAPFTPAVTERMRAMSPKEIELCHLIKRGLRCKEIARIMGISHRTVETHRNRIRRKLGIGDHSVNLASYLKGL